MDVATMLSHVGLWTTLIKSHVSKVRNGGHCMLVQYKPVSDKKNFTLKHILPF